MKLTISLAVVLMSATVGFSQSPCDPDLLRQANPSDVDRYTLRAPDRCEGLYDEQVDATIGDLQVVRLSARGAVPAEWPADGALKLYWHRYPVSDEIHIQAFPVASRKHYRLDVLKRGAQSYDWRTDIVKTYLEPDQIGLVIWSRHQDKRSLVYMPLLRDPTVPVNGYRLSIFSPTALDEVYLTISSAVPGEKPLRNRVPLKYGVYPSGENIDIPLPAFPKPGLYLIEVIADRADKGTIASPPFYIYHGQQP